MKQFQASKTAETEFMRALRKVGRTSAHIVESHLDGINLSKDMMKALSDYAKLIGPWAMRQSAKMLEQVSKANRKAYSTKAKQIQASQTILKNQARSISKELKLNVAETKVGKTANDLMYEQVELIKSIPIEAGLRAQKLAQEAVYDGSRYDEIANELLRTTEVTQSRAVLIARTETARANASINQARSTSVGARQYRWHNSGDAAVRESHRVYQGKSLQGRIFSWDSPPTLDDGMTGHPGTFPNCRCYAEPIFDDE